MQMSIDQIVPLIAGGTLETLYMTIVSTVFAYIIGLPLGIVMVVTRNNGLKPMPKLFMALDAIINIIRSAPFLILLIFVMPLTKLIVGTRIGSNATIVPLVISAAPFIARLVESSLMEVDKGVIEAAISMGASNWQIIKRVLLGEALPSLINGAAIAMTTILGYSAMAGATGGGGLGSIAIQYGYNRHQDDMMLITIILLVVIVQLIQLIGSTLSRKLDRRTS